MDRINRTSLNMFSSLLGYAIPMLINLASTPILLRMIGETAYGLQSLVAVIIGYMTVMDMGLDLPITKYLAEDHARNDTVSANKMLNNTLQLYLIIGFIGMTVIILFAKILSENVFKVPADMTSQAVIVFQLAGIGFLGSVGMSWGRAVSMGLQRFEITYGVAIVTNLAGIGFGLLLVYLGYGVVGFVLMRVLSTVCAGIAYWIIARILLPAYRFKLGFDSPTIRRVRSYIGYGVINRGLSAVVSRLDQTLIGIWLGVAAAGIYSIPFMIVNSLSYMIAYMLGFTFPMASELHSTGQYDKLNDIYIRSTRFITVLSCMIFLPMFIFGNSFMDLWVGKDVGSQTKTVLMLLTASFFLSTLFVTLPNSIAVGTGRIRQFTFYCVIRAAVLGLSCLIFIKSFGLNGAGFALILTNAVDFVFMTIVLKRYMNLSLLKLISLTYLKPLATGLILGAASLFLKKISITWPGLFFSVGIYEIIYLIVSYKINILGKIEKTIIGNVFRSIHKRLARKQV